MTEIQVTKRDGRRAPLDLEKMHTVVITACEDITGVSASEVELKSHLQFYSGIKTVDIQETLIKAAADLISEDTPNYQFVAGRLITYHLRKQVYGRFKPIPLYQHIHMVVDRGYYDSAILDWYSEDEFTKMDSFIDHSRDEEMTYAAMEQFRGKYLVKNRVTGEIFETPQMAYMLIAATLFHDYPEETRLDWVKRYYDAISTFDISLPTPVMAGVRTTQKQFASCVLIECGDSLDSINATSSAIVNYVSQKAGIGLGTGRIRAIKSPIRDGQATHTGWIPFNKHFQSAVGSCSQGGVRRGAATVYVPIWHLEIEDIVVLKNNKGTEETRARQMDYGIQFSKLFYERLIEGGDITLFSPSDVPLLYDAFYDKDDTDFRTLYETAERNKRLRKKKVSAKDLFTLFMQERKDTGRIYLMNVDNVNNQGSFDVPVRMSNLCCEITLPTKPLNDINDWSGEIATCILAAINLGKIKDPDDFKEPCELAVRGLESIISMQNYPVKAAQRATQGRRPLGVGLINLAYFLAKHDVKYSDDSALDLVDRYAEAWSYYLIKASADLAQELGPCEMNSETMYSRGLVPIDLRNKGVDDVIKHQERMPWKELRVQLKKTGIRNSTLMALMPSETSAQISNATNGVEPPRALVSIKQSKDGVLKQVVPEIRRLKNKYELLWDQPSPNGYLNIMAVLQKYVDQSISVNTSYNPEFYPEEEIPLSTLIQDVLTFYKNGGKCLYYFNTADGAGELVVEGNGPEDKEQPMLNEETNIDEEDCDSCIL